MAPIFVIVIKLNEFNPFIAFTTNVWNIGSTQYTLTIQRVKKEIL